MLRPAAWGCGCCTWPRPSTLTTALPEALRAFPREYPEPLAPTPAGAAGPLEPPLLSWPADAAAEPAPVRRAWAGRLFRRYERPPWPSGLRRYALHLGLFLLTLACTVLAGVQLARSGPVELLPLDVFSLPAAERWRQLGWGLLATRGRFWGCWRCTSSGTTSRRAIIRCGRRCPYFLPVPLGLGTFGAVIRVKDRIFSRREFFDIGLAGPLAGLAGGGAAAHLRPSLPYPTKPNICS
ncbi:MAG: hypothetical protein WKG07_32580 [Hymenobacter sp.]